jgi:hypothetical protein
MVKPFSSSLSSATLGSNDCSLICLLLQREIGYLEYQGEVSQLMLGQCPSLKEWKQILKTWSSMRPLIPWVWLQISITICRHSTLRVDKWKETLAGNGTCSVIN